MAASIGLEKLNDRARKYIEGLAQGMTKLEAKRFAQYAETTSSYTIETKDVKAAFAKLVRRACPAHKLSQKIAEGLEATETKFFQVKDQIIEREVVNLAERRQYLKMAVEYGQYADPNASAISGMPNEIGLRVTVEHIGRPENHRVIEGKQLSDGRE